MKTIHESVGHRSNHHRVRSFTNPQPPDPPHDVIAMRAYQLYVDCGCPDGRDVEFWLEAERQLKAPLRPR